MGKIKKTDLPCKKNKLVVPGELGELTENTFQPWQENSLRRGYQAGWNILFPYEDCEISFPAINPFISIDNNYYCLDIDLGIMTPKGIKTIVTPKYNNGLIRGVFDTDLWPGKIRLFFFYKQEIVKFTHNESFAYALPLVEMNDSIFTAEELNLRREAVVKAEETLPTRDWMINNYRQDNQQEVYCHKAQKGREIWPIVAEHKVFFGKK